jgi:hypothetical protein
MTTELPGAHLVAATDEKPHNSNYSAWTILFAPKTIEAPLLIIHLSQSM